MPRRRSLGARRGKISGVVRSAIGQTGLPPVYDKRRGYFSFSAVLYTPELVLLRKRGRNNIPNRFCDDRKDSFLQAFSLLF